MTSQLLDAKIVDGPFLIGLYLLTGIVVLVLLLRRASGRRTLITVASVAVGFLFGWVLTWLISDVWDVFGVSLSTVTRMWVSAFFAGATLAIANLIGTRWRRKVVTIVALPLCLIAAAAGINVDFGQFTTVRDALGISKYESLDAALASPVDSSRGTVGTVTIPPTVSGFNPRDALVYLPPIARAEHPPVLPVVEMLSGQPGSPEDVFTAGHLADILDAFAATHGGFAPIVVVPDQLGAPEKNPMCVDSQLGNAATYLTVDVPAWVRAKFNVAAAPKGWTIAGFSQGGTCAIQLGAAHPELYGTILDIAGELVPQSGSLAQTIRIGFGGSQAAFAAAAPAAILAQHAPYAALNVIFAVGGDDAKYLAWAHTLTDAATRAGATTKLIVSPGTAHDWYTVVYAWGNALPIISDVSGLSVSP